MSFEAGEENQLFKGVQEHSTVMTFMEATSDEIHDTLNDVINGQTHYRLVSLIARFIRVTIFFWNILYNQKSFSCVFLFPARGTWPSIRR